jgi:hypothetical protein
MEAKCILVVELTTYSWSSLSPPTSFDTDMAGGFYGHFGANMGAWITVSMRGGAEPLGLPWVGDFSPVLFSVMQTVDYEDDLVPHLLVSLAQI